MPHRAAGGELLLLQPTPALADGAESWAQVSTSKSRGYHGVDDFGTLHITAMLGPHARHKRAVSYLLGAYLTYLLGAGAGGGRGSDAQPLRRLLLRGVRLPRCAGRAGFDVRTSNY